MTESHAEEPSIVASSSDVGKRLREAREANNISVIDAAAQLRVTRDAIHYLETQQWDKLHGRTYARGYFLSYVKFLGLPQDEMIAGFNLEFNEVESERQSHAPVQSLKPARNSFPWLVVVLLIAVLVAGWFGYQHWQTSKSVVADSDTSSADSPMVEPLESEEVIEHSSGAATDDLIDGAAAELTDSAEPIPADSAAPVPVMPTDEFSSEDNAAASIADDSMSMAAAENITEPVTETALMEENAAESGHKTLIIGLAADCWVEVRDASQQVLISRVVRGGNTVELAGEAPLRVSLGQANAASVRFDGDIVDITQYTRGNVARFTLGEEL